MNKGLFEAITRVKYTSYKELTLATIVIWLLLSCALIYKYFPDVYAMNLSDNDDYMRYLQFTGWIKNGNWYLEPLPQFNPQDGVIMHWSRIPDFLLAGFTILGSLFLTGHMAETIAMSITPLLYFIVFLIAIGTFTYRVFGNQYTFTMMVFILASMVIGKFYPGSIDHHNIQLTLAALFLTLTPFKRYECKTTIHAIVQGIVLGLSFWVGLENLIFLVAILIMLTLFGYIYSVRFLYYVKLICCSAIICCTIFIPLNRPIDEFFISKVDALSISYLLTLCCGYLFCWLSIISLKKYNSDKIITYIFIGVISLAPIVYFYPELILGVYYNYPPELYKFWLSHVIEAKSTINYIQLDGFFSPKNYILPLLPAFFAILYIRKNPVLLSIYILFIFLSLPFIFWQIRTSNIALLVAVPLQAYFAIQFCKNFQSTVLQIITTLLFAPLCLAILFSYLGDYISEPHTNNTKSLQSSDVIALINKHHISNSKILAPIDYGAKIITLTNNQIISAPYHRNIKGNKLSIDIFTATDLDKAYQKLQKNHINYIMFGIHSTSRLFSIYSDKSSLINQLYNDHYPLWLTLIEHNEQGFFLFKVNTQ